MTSDHRTEGELLFLTDSAYLSLIDEEQSVRPSNGKEKHDGLFLERLDSFVEGQMRDMTAFADREQHSLDEIRKLVAIPHAKFLFSSEHEATPRDPSTPSVRAILARLSSVLQRLHSTAGLESLLLVVAPTPTAVPPTSSATTSSEASWIGGTEHGKEFWMGLKGGGVPGIRAFRTRCRAAEASTPTSAHSRSGDIKMELNAAVRHALRTASGNSSAEMRWTRPATLEETYGVRMRGWPEGIMRRNPSNNTVRENRTLLECIRSGSMRFVSRGSAEWNDAALEIDSTEGEHHGVEKMRRVDRSRAPPVVSAPSPSLDESQVTEIVAPSTSHNESLLYSTHTKAANRPAELDTQGRLKRRRTGPDSG